MNADESSRRSSSKLAEVGDLIHLDAPLQEDTILRALQARFFNQKYFVSLIYYIIAFHCM